MLGSTLLSAATALFFLPAVFSAPVTTPDTSVTVSDVSTTISTTKAATIQKITTVFVEKKSQLDAMYTNLLVVDTSKVDLAYATDLCGQVTGTLHDAINEVQAACTLAESAVAVEVGVDTLIEAIGGVLVAVFHILGRIVVILGGVEGAVLKIVGGVLVVVISLLSVVVSAVGALVPQILLLVGEVLFKVEGLVDIIKALVACNVSGIVYLVAYLGIQLP